MKLTLTQTKTGMGPEQIWKPSSDQIYSGKDIWKPLRQQHHPDHVSHL